ncbi:hypothetical protein [Rhizobium ruizarguesonis]|uniref:hypothetical protein n=1 Tax=Rhizobium ruizarguesonis TaxID=2081791 RepID=UPI00371E9F83
MRANLLAKATTTALRCTPLSIIAFSHRPIGVSLFKNDGNAVGAMDGQSAQIGVAALGYPKQPSFAARADRCEPFGARLAETNHPSGPLSMETLNHIPNEINGS